jgi:hypothetical protein
MLTPVARQTVIAGGEPKNQQRADGEMGQLCY